MGRKTLESKEVYEMKKKRILIILAALVLVGASFRLGKPSVLQTLGLHPEYDGQRYLLPY